MVGQSCFSSRPLRLSCLLAVSLAEKEDMGGIVVYTEDVERNADMRQAGRDRYAISGV